MTVDLIIVLITFAVAGRFAIRGMIRVDRGMRLDYLETVADRADQEHKRWLEGDFNISPEIDAYHRFLDALCRPDIRLENVEVAIDAANAWTEHYITNGINFLMPLIEEDKPKKRGGQDPLLDCTIIEWVNNDLIKVLAEGDWEFYASAQAVRDKGGYVDRTIAAIPKSVLESKKLCDNTRKELARLEAKNKAQEKDLDKQFDEINAAMDDLKIQAVLDLQVEDVMTQFGRHKDRVEIMAWGSEKPVRVEYI